MAHQLDGIDMAAGDSRTVHTLLANSPPADLHGLAVLHVRAGIAADRLTADGTPKVHAEAGATLRAACGEIVAAIDAAEAKGGREAAILQVLGGQAVAFVRDRAAIRGYRVLPLATV